MTRIKEFMRQTHGFTLIELSIVLVIIGLIVGGILVGQDLIKAGEVRAQISQIEKFNSAVNTFRGKFGGLPGDLALSQANQYGFLMPTSCTGAQGQRDGNGLIDGGPGTTNVGGSATLAALMGENALFWMDLSSAGMGDVVPPIGSSSWNVNQSINNVCGYSTTATDPGTYVPRGRIGYGTYVHVYEVSGYNWYLLAAIQGFSAGSSAVTGNFSIPVMSAYNIDKKMDDGLPVTGVVRAISINNQCCTTNAPSAPNDSTTTCYNTTSSAYSISSLANYGTGGNCALSFRFQ